jgi:hypothetical protein
MTLEVDVAERNTLRFVVDISTPPGCDYSTAKQMLERAIREEAARMGGADFDFGRSYTKVMSWPDRNKP